MHLLAAQPGQIVDGSEAVDLGQSPGEIVFISAADTELAALAAARDWTDKPLHLIIGMINSKAPEDFLRPLAPLAASVTGVAVPGETASLTPEDISAAAAGLGLPNHEAKDVKAALAWISRQDGPGRILVCGSLYLVGDVLACHTHAPNC